LREPVWVLVVLFFVAGCAGDPSPVSSTPLPTGETAAPAATHTLTATPTSAPTATATPTPQPTDPALRPTALPSPTNPPPQPTAAESGPASYVPAGQSVWEVPVAPDNMVGTCSSDPIAVPYGLIAITPEGDALTFRDQGVGTYAFRQAALNVYVYQGRNNLVAGNLDMTLAFTSPTTWVMHAVTILDSDPACQHIHDYAAVFKWSR